jgi:bifunctional DNase/RNase
MIEVVIDSVRVSLTNQQRIVFLREQKRERYLPIWIGPFEAEAITISLQEIEVARPQTHDLLIKSLETLGARLERVEVVGLKGDIFYGNLVIQLDGKVFNVDSRPSDAIALAARAHIPVLVADEILDEAGIEPEVDMFAQLMRDETPSQEDAEIQVEPEDAKKRLSIFEDFLENMKSEHPGEEDDSPKKPDDDKNRPESGLN